MWKVLCNIIQGVKTMLLSKDNDVATVFSICMKHHNKAVSRDLGFTSAR